MRALMRVLRNVCIAMVMLVGVVIIMPKSVWAGTLSLDHSTLNVQKDGTATLKVTYSLETDEMVGFDYDDATAISVTPGATPAGLSGTWTLTVRGLQVGGSSTITVGIYDKTDTTHSSPKTTEDCSVVVDSATGSLNVTTAGLIAGVVSGPSFTVSATGVGHTLVTPITWDITGTGMYDLSISGNNASETVDIDTYATLPISATITATDAEGVKGSVTVNITKINVGTITVEDSLGLTEGTFYIDDTETLFATPNPDMAGLGLTWSSSNASVCKVVKDPDDDRMAEITAVNGGTANITVSAPGGKNAVYKVTVENPADTLIITATPTIPSEAKGKSDIKLVAKATASNGKAVYPALVAADYVWSSNDTTVATVSKATGDTINVKGIDEGTATITVDIDKFVLSESIDVTITAGVPVTSFKLPKSMYITKGKSIKVNATIAPADAAVKKVTWYVTGSGSGLSKIDSDTYVTIKATSSATGSATVDGVIENGAGTGNDVPAENTTKITVVNAPETVTEYKSSSRTMKVSLPTGVGSGSDSFAVTGYCVEAMSGSSSLSSVYITKEPGDEIAIDASTFEKVVSKIDSSKLSGDKDSIKFRISPAYVDGSKKSADVYVETDSVSVYKVTLSKGKGVSSVSPTSQWGLEGQKISISASLESNASESDFKWTPSDAIADKSAKSTTITVSTDTSKNKVTAETTTSSSNSSNSSTGGKSSASGSGSSSGSNSNLDKVPKTGERGGLWAIWVIFFAVIAGAGATLFVMLKKSK